MTDQRPIVNIIIAGPEVAKPNTFKRVEYRYGKFDPEHTFKNYDWFEEYDASKVYLQEEYTRDYGKGERKYVNELCVCDNKSFVVGHEVLSVEELEELEPFCPCVRCGMYWFDPRRILNPCWSVGCIKAGPFFAWYDNVNKARVAKNYSFHNISPPNN
jgi:hypothetical protein